ncbi:MAG: family hydrolase [Acidimicrobiia bacterium]|nr:family hydrolase [Acidimicrobiia bacterium]
MTTNRAGVLFDVDGTLADSNYLHTIAWARTLAEIDEWAPMHAIHRLVGAGGNEFTTRLLGRSEPKANEIENERFLELQPEVRLFPGARELLMELHREGLAVVLATSAPQKLLDAMIKLLDVGDALTAVTSADDVEHAKPEPDVFLAALAAGSVDPKRCVVVGDSIWDVQAADAAGLGCIGLESGGFSRHELSEEGALAVYRNTQHLLDQWRLSPLRLLLT